MTYNWLSIIALVDLVLQYLVLVLIYDYWGRLIVEKVATKIAN